MNKSKQLTPKQKAEKEVFDSAYNWGRWNIVVDHTAPAFQMALRKLEAEIRKEVKNERV